MTLADNWPVLRGVFEGADERLTRRRVPARWPCDHDRPSLPTLRRWLDRAAGGLVERRGAGRRASPFRYGPPGFEPLLPELPDLRTCRQGSWSLTGGRGRVRVVATEPPTRFGAHDAVRARPTTSA